MYSYLHTFKTRSNTLCVVGKETLVSSCLWNGLPPVSLRAVCLVRAMVVVVVDDSGVYDLVGFRGRFAYGRS